MKVLSIMSPGCMEQSESPRLPVLIKNKKIAHTHYCLRVLVNSFPWTLALSSSNDVKICKLAEPKKIVFMWDQASKTQCWKKLWHSGHRNYFQHLKERSHLRNSYCSSEKKRDYCIRVSHWRKKNCGKRWAIPSR